MSARDALIAQLMAQPCLWPECSCAAKYERLTGIVAQWNADEAVVPQEQLDAVLIEGQTMLACIAHRCRDKRMRATALVDLLRPIFNNIPAAETRLLEADAETGPDRSLLGMYPLTAEAKRLTKIAETRRGFRVVAGAKREQR